MNRVYTSAWLSIIYDLSSIGTLPLLIFRFINENILKSIMSLTIYGKEELYSSFRMWTESFREIISRKKNTVKGLSQNTCQKVYHLLLPCQSSILVYTLPTQRVSTTCN